MKVAQLLDCFARGRTSLADAQRLNAEPLARQLARGQACADQPTLGDWLRVPPRQSLPPSGGWGGSSFQGVRRPAALVTHARRLAVPAAWLGVGTRGSALGADPHGGPPGRLKPSPQTHELRPSEPSAASVRESGLSSEREKPSGHARAPVARAAAPLPTRPIPRPPATWRRIFPKKSPPSAFTLAGSGFRGAGNW